MGFGNKFNIQPVVLECLKNIFYREVHVKVNSTSDNDNICHLLISLETKKFLRKIRIKIYSICEIHLLSSRFVGKSEIFVVTVR
jgi:hypothetical protein